MKIRVIQNGKILHDNILFGYKESNDIKIKLPAIVESLHKNPVSNWETYQSFIKHNISDPKWNDTYLKTFQIEKDKPIQILLY